MREWNDAVHRLALAADSGHVPPDDRAQVAGLMARAADLLSGSPRASIAVNYTPVEDLSAGPLAQPSPAVTVTLSLPDRGMVATIVGERMTLAHVPPGGDPPLGTAVIVIGREQVPLTDVIELLYATGRIG